MLLQELEKKKLIHPPSWLPDTCQYLVSGGSIMYGCSTNTSDFDVLGWAIPRRETIFPHLAGVIQGFGRQIQSFEQWIEHHIVDKDAQGGAGREYDFQVWGIVKFFQLLLDGNPGATEIVFAAQDCVLHCTAIAQMVREERKYFLHKGIIPRLRGYSMSQLSKAGSQNRIGKRAEGVKEHGVDYKFLSHTYRLALQAEQILQTGDLDLRRDRETIKAVRRGEVTLEETREWFTHKERHLEKLYEQSNLRWGPDEDRLKSLLLKCLEHHYGSLEKCVTNTGVAEQTIIDIRTLLEQRGF
jgi:uncharacterized protein